MKKITSLAVITAIAASVSTSASSAEVTAPDNRHQVRIVGGEEAKQGDYPFMTALVSRESEDIRPFCGASFIGGRYVLTASHCLEGTEAENLSVWISGYDTQTPEGGQKVNVAQIYMHEEYFSDFKDVAILELEQEIQGVTPVKLMTAEMEAELQDGQLFTVMGWGNMDPAAGAFPNILHQVEVPLFNHVSCTENYAQNGQRVAEHMLCAGFPEGKKDSCQGDSGGPLIYKHNDEWYQAGVVSWGNGCALEGFPGVYANVGKFQQWLKQKQAGVSYRQTTRNGYVGQDFDEQLSFTFQNVGNQAYGLTAIAIENVENLTVVNGENSCEGKTLSTEQSCDFNIQVKADQVGDGKFQIRVETNHPVNQSALMYFETFALEASALDMPQLVGADNSYVQWYSGGDQTWLAQTAKVSQDESAVASGDISHSQRSVLLASIKNPRVAKLQLKYLVSSEPGYDNFDVLLNNQRKLRVSGTEQVEFENLQLELSDKDDRIALVFAKDSFDVGDVGDSKAYMDDIRVEISNETPEAKVAQASIRVEENKTFSLDASSSTDADQDPLSYEWKQLSGTNISLANSKLATLSLTAPAVTDGKEYIMAFAVTVSDNFGASSTQEVQITVTPKPKSGGGLGWLVLLPLILVVNRRR